MQLTSASILGMPSNLSRSSANSPAATIAQRDARGSATDRRPGPTLGTQVVVIPPGSRLTDCQITYFDIPNGHHHVEHQSELIRVPDGQDVRVIKRVVKYVDDPDSFAIIVALPTRRPGVMRPALGITHRKLRYLFNAAINWSLTRDRLHFQDGAASVYTFTSCFDHSDATLAMLPEELTTVEVCSDGLNFDPPMVKFVEPSTIGWRLVSGGLTLIAGLVFVKVLMFFVAVVLETTETDAYVHAVRVTARELDAAFTTIRRVLYSTARVAAEQADRHTSHVVAFFEEM